MRGEYGLNLVDAIILVKMWLQLKRLYRWIIIAIENFIFFGFFFPEGDWVGRPAQHFLCYWPVNHQREIYVIW